MYFNLFKLGGLKTWECALDLAAFLIDEVPASELNNSKVLELGCGKYSSF